MTELTPEEVREWLETARGLLFETLHGPVPMETTAEMAMAVRALHGEVERLRAQPSPHDAWRQGFMSGLGDGDGLAISVDNPYPKPDTPPRRTLSRDEVVECAKKTWRAGLLAEFPNDHWNRATVEVYFDGQAATDIAAALAKREGE